MVSLAAQLVSPAAAGKAVIDELPRRNYRCQPVESMRLISASISSPS